MSTAKMTLQRRMSFPGGLTTTCLIIAAVAVASPMLEETQESHSGLEPVGLRVGFTRSSFTGVNEADARAACKVFSAKVGETRGYKINSSIVVFDDLAQLATEVEKDALDLVILATWDYLTLSPTPKMPIELVTVEQGVMVEEYLVLVRSDAGLTDLADLEDRSVIVLDSSNASTGKHWFRTELMGMGYSHPSSFLGRFEIKEKPSHVVLPVFFGNADACIVDRSGFETMTELNPQVGRELRVIARSAAYLDTVACVRRDGWETPRHRTDLIAALHELYQDPAGRQLGSLFKFDDLIPFEDHYLDSVRALHRRHDRLTSDLALRSNGVGGQ